MKTMASWSLCLLMISCLHLVLSDPYVIHTTEAFYVPISHTWFPTINKGAELEYRATLDTMPDLPHWMYCRQPNGSKDALLYGVATVPGHMKIEIVAMNKYNYNVERKVLDLEVREKTNVAVFHVEIKLLNLNLEDILNTQRLEYLVEIFRDHLWKEGGSDVYLTQIASSVDVGGRLPLNPREKEGVVIRIGAPHNFSLDLYDLEREVLPLRTRVPCPRDYKRTSAEHLFRRRNFISDWCHFQLIADHKASSSRNDFDSSILKDEFQKQRIEIPKREFLSDFVISLVIPGILVFVLLGSLSSVMCGQREFDEKPT